MPTVPTIRNAIRALLTDKPLGASMAEIRQGVQHSPECVWDAVSVMRRHGELFALPLPHKTRYFLIAEMRDAAASEVTETWERDAKIQAARNRALCIERTRARRALERAARPPKPPTVKPKGRPPVLRARLLAYLADLPLGASIFDMRCAVAAAASSVNDAVGDLFRKRAISRIGAGSRYQYFATDAMRDAAAAEVLARWAAHDAETLENKRAKSRERSRKQYVKRPVSARVADSFRARVLDFAAVAGMNGLASDEMPGENVHRVGAACSALVKLGKLHKARIAHKSARYFATAEWAAKCEAANAKPPRVGPIRARPENGALDKFKAQAPIIPAHVHVQRIPTPPPRFSVDPQFVGLFGSMRPGQYLDSRTLEKS